MSKVRRNRITKTQKTKVLKALKKGVKPSVIVKRLKLKSHQVYNLSIRLKKQQKEDFKVVKANQRAKIANSRTYLISTEDALANGTDKEKVEALVKYLGKEALKALLKD